MGLVLSLIGVISVMVSDVVLPKLGNSKPIIVTANKPMNNVAVNRMLSSIFKSAPEGNEKLFTNVCGSCHNISKTANHKVGPNLWDVVFSKIASSVKFRYSSAMAKLANSQ